MSSAMAENDLPAQNHPAVEKLAFSEQRIYAICADLEVVATEIKHCLCSLKGNQEGKGPTLMFRGRDESSKMSLGDRVSFILSNLEEDPKHFAYVKFQLEQVRAEIEHLELRVITQRASDSVKVSKAKRDLRLHKQQVEVLMTENEKLKAQMNQRLVKENSNSNNKELGG